MSANKLALMCPCGHMACTHQTNYGHAEVYVFGCQETDCRCAVNRAEVIEAALASSPVISQVWETTLTPCRDGGAK